MDIEAQLSTFNGRMWITKSNDPNKTNMGMKAMRTLRLILQINTSQSFKEKKRVKYIIMNESL